MCVCGEETSNVAKSLELTAASCELHVQYGVWWRGFSQLCAGRPWRKYCTPSWLLRSHRTQEQIFATDQRAISASATGKASTSYQTLTDRIDSSAPIACNLSNFHMLGVHPGTVSACGRLRSVKSRRADPTARFLTSCSRGRHRASTYEFS
jgi:hypothetical protein